MQEIVICQLNFDAHNKKQIHIPMYIVPAVLSCLVWSNVAIVCMIFIKKKHYIFELSVELVTKQSTTLE